MLRQLLRLTLESNYCDSFDMIFQNNILDETFFHLSSSLHVFNLIKKALQQVSEKRSV